MIAILLLLGAPEGGEWSVRKGETEYVVLALLDGTGQVRRYKGGGCEVLSGKWRRTGGGAIAFTLCVPEPWPRNTTYPTRRFLLDVKGGRFGETTDGMVPRKDYKIRRVRRLYLP